VIGRHTHPQAAREVPPPPIATGIDYLKLLADQRDAEIPGHPIDFASLAQPDGEDRDNDQEGRDR